MPTDAAGSGGNGSGRERTISSRVRSVSRPASRSSMVSAMNRVDATPSPVKPEAYATRPSRATPVNAVNCVDVSITPAHRCVKRSPSSCG